MHSPDAGAGEHGDGRLRHHGQVNHNPVLRLHPLSFQDIGKTAHLALKLLIRQGPPVTRFTFPNDGRFVLPCGIGGMAVHAVFRNVQLPTAKPLGKGRLPLQHATPGLLPRQLSSFCCPESRGILDAQGILLPVSGQALDTGSFGKLGRWGEDAVFHQMGLRGLAHFGYGKSCDYQPSFNRDNPYHKSFQPRGGSKNESNGGRN